MKQLKESILAGGIAESILDSDFDAPDLLFDLKRFNALNNRQAFERFENDCIRFNWLNFRYNFFCNLKNEQDNLLKAADDCFSDEEQKKSALDNMAWKFYYGSLASSDGISRLQKDIKDLQEPDPREGMYLNTVFKFVQKLDNFLNKQIRGYSKMEIDVEDIGRLIRKSWIRDSSTQRLTLVFRNPNKSLDNIKALDGKTIEGYNITFSDDPKEIEYNQPYDWRNDECVIIKIMP